jgi:hypothetical protein
MLMEAANESASLSQVLYGGEHQLLPDINSIVGRMRYKGSDTVIPSQYYLTVGVWLIITIPAVFVLAIV